MEYEALGALLQQRMPAVLATVRSALINAGVAANRITGPREVNYNEAVPDLRYELIVTRAGGHVLTIWLEFTPAVHFGGTDPALASFTIHMDYDGAQNAFTYDRALGFNCFTDAGQAALLAKWQEVVDRGPELLAAARNRLGV